MKDQKNFHRTESGVSELIGALILISMIVLVVAIIAAGMISHPSADKVPQVRFSVVNSTKLIDGVIQPPYSIIVTHEGGDEISDGNYAVFIDGKNITNFTISSNPDMKWSVGRGIMVNMTAPPGQVSVYYTGTNFPTLLGQRIVGNTTSTTTTTYTITASAGIGGSISPSGAVIVPSGSSQTFTISSNSGYHIDVLTVDGSPATLTGPNTYTFTNVQASHTISVTFASITYTISPSAGPNGTISPSTPQIVSAGGSSAFTISSNSGYHIDVLTVDGSPATLTGPNTYTFTNVQASHTISVTFSINTYTINASAGTGGSISPNGTVIVNSGNTQAFTISPNSGYTISAVLIDGISQGALANYSFSNVVMNHSISATFAATITYTITASAGTGGSISPSGSVIVNYGNSQTFTITSNSGYAIANVLVDGTYMGAIASYTFSNVVGNHAISVTFVAIPTYTITTSAGTGGSISPSGPVTVNSGNSQAFTITPNNGYSILAVTVDGVSQGAISSYTFTNVQANHAISATFTIKTYTIIASAGTGGTISPSGSINVNYGNSQAFTIAPDNGYSILAVTVDGVSQGTISSFTFTNVQANHAISATFAGNPYTITVTWSPPGLAENQVISTSPPIPAINVPNGKIVDVIGGTDQTFYFNGKNQKKVQDVMVDGVTVGPPTPVGTWSYTFTNIVSSHTLYVYFR